MGGQSPSQGAHRRTLGIRAGGMDATVGEREDAIGHVGEDGGVGDDDGQRAEFAVDVFNGLEHGDAGVDVEGPRGFVAEEHRRTLGDGAGDGDALLFAAGHLRREVVEAAAEPDEVEGLFGGHGGAGDLGDQGDVFAGGKARNQVVELKDKADGVAAVLREGRLVGCAQIPAAVKQRARSGRVEPPNVVEQGGLAAAGRAEQDDEFAGMKIEIDAGQRGDRGFAGAVDLGQATDRKDRLPFAGRAGRNGWRESWA